MAESTSKYLVAVFDHETKILSGVKTIREKGVKIFEAYTPFPVHGLDTALGYERSKLSRAAFAFGITGTFTAISMQTYMLGFDWPMNIGGKPSFAWPSFVPVTFELTVLFASLGMVASFFYVSRLAPGRKNKIFDIRATDDKFITVVKLDSNSKSESEISEILKSSGAEEVKEVVL
jgi:hypothetical protein